MCMYIYIHVYIYIYICMCVCVNMCIYVQVLATLLPISSRGQGGTRCSAHNSAVYVPIPKTLWHDAHSAPAKGQNCLLLRLHTHGGLCHVTNPCVTWLIHVWHDLGWLIHMWHDSLMCDMTDPYVTWLIDVWHDLVWHDSSMCDMTKLSFAPTRRMW